MRRPESYCLALSTMLMNRWPIPLGSHQVPWHQGAEIEIILEPWLPMLVGNAYIFFDEQSLLGLRF